MAVTEQETKQGETETQVDKTDGVDAQDQQSADNKQSGPTFTEGPNPLEGFSRGMTNLWNSMEGKSVSMRLYVGTILGVVVLMLLARCGG